MGPKEIAKRFEKYGKANCEKAYRANVDDGYGASSIGLEILPYRPDGKNWTTRQVDAMCLTWEKHLKRTSYTMLKDIGLEPTKLTEVTGEEAGRFVGLEDVKGLTKDYDFVFEVLVDRGSFYDAYYFVERDNAKKFMEEL